MLDNAPKKYTVSGPKGTPFLGMIREAKQDSLKMMMDLALNYGDIVPFKVLGQNVIQLNHPDLIKYVLVDNHKNYKKSSAYIRFHSVLGLGLFTSEGEKWRRDRQKIQPMFKREQVEGYYFDVISEVANKFKARWSQLADSGNNEINLTSEMADITLEIIAKLVFGNRTIDDSAVKSIHSAYDLFMAYLKQPRLIPTVDLRKLFRTGEYRRFDKELNRTRILFRQLMEECRKDNSKDRLSMLSLLLDAQKADPENFTDEDILEQCFTMIFAGFESTSILLQWMWYALNEHPDVKHKLRAEIAAQLPNIAFNYEEMNKLTYLQAFFEESVRFYPPFWITGREPIEDDLLGNYILKRGTLLVLPQYGMHHHPRYWSDVEKFMPERFLSIKVDDLHPGIYFPFSHGPRKCSGHRLAEMEAKMMLVKLLPLFDVTILNAAHECGFDPSISLKPKQSLYVNIKRA